MHFSLFYLGILLAAAFVVSALSFGRDPSSWSFVQMMGAGSLNVAFLAHTAEFFDWLPGMRWHQSGSPGQLIWLISSIGALALPVGGFFRWKARRRPPPEG